MLKQMLSRFGGTVSCSACADVQLISIATQRVLIPAKSGFCPSDQLAAVLGMLANQLSFSLVR